MLLPAVLLPLLCGQEESSKGNGRNRKGVDRVERERDVWKRERCEGRHQANENGAEKVVNGKE